jgi:hypothetical protein
MNPNIILLNISDVDKPKDGVFMIHIDHWWIVKDNQIMLYRDYAPQCNTNKEIATKIRDKIYPDCEVRQLPVIYLEYRD